jgi:Flp pilus assembly pilin Flp
MTTEAQRTLGFANRLNRNGNAYIEYFVLALIAALATLAFFNKGGFAGAQGKIKGAFDEAVTTVLAP